MPEVKTRSSLRAEQAAVTRRRILDAAAAVFVEQGFSGARIDEIAGRAGVAAATVYKVFGTKRDMLVAAVRGAMTGTVDADAVDTQAWWIEQLDEPGAEEQLRLIARNARRIYERAGALLEVLRAAAPLDAALGDAWRSINDDRLARGRRSAAALVAKAGPRARQGEGDIAATLWSLSGPELFAVYTSTRPSAARYEEWLGDILCRALLD